MLRALPLTMRHTPLQRLPIDPRLLAAICRVCDNLSAMGIVLKLAFLVAFFGFLRQSNLAPPSPRTFDPSRHTTRGDVTVQAPRFGHQIKVEQNHAGGRHSSSHPHSSHPGSSPRSRGRIPGYVTPSAHSPPQGAPADTAQWQTIVRAAAPAGPQRWIFVVTRFCYSAGGFTIRKWDPGQRLFWPSDLSSLVTYQLSQCTAGVHTAASTRQG